MMKSIKIMWLLLAITTLNSCLKDKANEEITEEVDCNAVTFTSNVQPIFASSCAVSGCHDAATMKAGITLETYEQIKEDMKNGDSWCAIQHLSGCVPMPLGSSTGLSEDKITILKCWVDANYPQN